MHIIQKLIKSGNGYIHYNTTNRSFLDVMEQLKNREVKNHYFMLALFDPTLAEIDPFREDLTKDQQIAVMIECSRNPWYFFREILRIPNGKNVDKFTLDLSRSAILYCIVQGYSVWKAGLRQSGDSTISSGIILWRYMFDRIDQTKTGSGIMSATINDAKNILRRVKNMNGLLPSYLKMDDKVFFHMKHEKSYDDELGYCMNTSATGNYSRIGIFRKHIDAEKTKMSISRMNSLYAFMYYDMAEFITNMPDIISSIENNPILSTCPEPIEVKENRSFLSSLFKNKESDTVKEQDVYACDIGLFIDLLYNRIKSSVKLFCSVPNDLKHPEVKRLNEEVFPHMLKWLDYYYDIIPTPAFNKYIEDIKSKDPDFNNIMYIEYDYKDLGYSEAQINQLRRMLSNDTIFRREVLLERFNSEEK